MEIRNLIKQLGRAKTVILSTHILSEVQATCDRVLIINEGKIVADGSPQQLQQQFHSAESITLELRSAVDDPPDRDAAEILAPCRRSPASPSSRTRTAPRGFELHAEKGADVREAAFRAAVAEGWVSSRCTARSPRLKKYSTS